jgi:hypothetical protein
MSLSLHVRKALVCCSLALGIPILAVGQGAYTTNGFEYPITASKPGDQVHPEIALNSNGGFVVWEDNVTSSSGLAISAQRLDSSFSRTLSSFKVNAATVGDHERAHVALLSNGGAVFVWQGGRFGYQHIYARFLSSSNVWLTGDIMANGSTNIFQIDPVVATLNNGNVMVAWSSFNQSSPTSMRDIYGQMFSPDGQKIGNEFLINQFTTYNQRTPAIAALGSGGFVAVWVSEQQRRTAALNGQSLSSPQMLNASVDIYARLFSANGQPSQGEFLVNTASNVCANPSVAGAQDGSFVVAWSEKDQQMAVNGWDIFARAYSPAAVGGTVTMVNTEIYGDQLGAHVSAAGTDYLVIWTSYGQDSSMEGVYGQFLHGDGSSNGTEFRANTTWVSRQIHPAVASDGSGRFVVTWTSFTGGNNSFDLFAQRYVNAAQPLQAMAAPFVYVPFVVNNGVYQPQIVVSWPAQTGLSVDHYDVYVDGTLATSSTNNTWTMTIANGLAASSTHTFQVAALGTDTRQTPLSPPASATTWSGYSWGGVPFEWMTTYFGADISKWPVATNPLNQGGPTAYQVFLTGGNPSNPSTWLQTSLEANQVQGQPVYLLHWNTQPGLTYQVQMSSDMLNWVDFQTPRFAADVADSVIVPNNNLQYYRLVRLR